MYAGHVTYKVELALTDVIKIGWELDVIGVILHIMVLTAPRAAA